MSTDIEFKVYNHFLKLKAGTLRSFDYDNPSKQISVDAIINKTDSAKVYGISTLHLRRAYKNPNFMSRKIKKLSLPNTITFFENLDCDQPGEIVRGALVEEVSPNILELCVSTSSSIAPGKSRAVAFRVNLEQFNEIIPDAGIEMREFLRTYTVISGNDKVLNEALHFVIITLAAFTTKCDLGKGKATYTCRDNNNRKASYKYPYYILNLGEKVEREDYERRYSRGFTWNYRTEILGFWRKKDPQVPGKDKEGVYRIKGFTWVIPHIRGNPDNPLAPKKPTFVKF